MVKINNSINDTVGGANSGATNTFTITNTSNTLNSAANGIISVAGASAGNVWSQYTIAGTRSYSFGMNNPSSTNLQINTAAGSSVQPSTGTQLWRMSPAGVRNLPLQPAFLARLTTNNTLPTLVNTNIVFDNIVADQGSNVSTIFQGEGNSPATTFTCPVSGMYMFWVQTAFSNIQAGAISQIAIATNNPNRNHIAGTQYDLVNLAINGVGGHTIFSNLSIVQLSAGNQVWINFVYGANSSGTVLIGFSSPGDQESNTVFGGYLIA